MARLFKEAINEAPELLDLAHISAWEFSECTGTQFTPLKTSGFYVQGDNREFYWFVLKDPEGFKKACEALSSYRLYDDFIGIVSLVISNCLYIALNRSHQLHKSTLD